MCNKLNIIKREKKKLISDLNGEIILRKESDAQLMSEVEASETLIKSLGNRNMTMEESLDEARRINEGYSELLKVLKVNPPYLESHVQSLEVEYSLADKQFKELVAFRTKLYEEAEKIDQVGTQRVYDRVQYYEHARDEVAVRMDEVRAFIKTHKKEQKFAFNKFIPALAPFMNQSNVTRDPHYPGFTQATGRDDDDPVKDLHTGERGSAGKESSSPTHCHPLTHSPTHSLTHSHSPSLSPLPDNEDTLEALRRNQTMQKFSKMFLGGLRRNHNGSGSPQFPVVGMNQYGEDEEELLPSSGIKVHEVNLGYENTSDTLDIEEMVREEMLLQQKV